MNRESSDFVIVSDTKMINENFTYKSSTHPANLNNMRLGGKLCDVIVKVEDKEIRAHKVVLAAGLKYFESMFLNSFQESKQDVILMKDVNASDLEAFVTFAYTGEMSLTKSNALGLLKAANYLSEDAIKKACMDYLEVHLDVNDAFRAYKYANAVENLPLKIVAKSRILSNFGVCSQTTEYLDLDLASLKDVMNEVNHYPVESQQVLFEGIMRWIMHDPTTRRENVQHFLSFVDGRTFGSDYLMNYVGSMADRSDEEFIILKNVMAYNKQFWQDKNVVLMLLGNIGDQQLFQFYNFTERKWSTLQEIPFHSDRATVYYTSAISQSIYYVSHNSDNETRTLEVFDTTKKRRTTVLSSHCILGYSAMCACYGCVYLCGGRDVSSDPADQVLIYDTRGNTIEKLTSMGTKRFGASAAIYQGHLLVLGGFSDVEHGLISPSVEKYDFVMKNWSSFPSMNVGRAWHAVAVLEEKLYACGGHTNNGGVKQADAEVYDQGMNCWQLIGKMKKGRNQFLLIAHEGKLWAIGGDENRTVEVYDPRINRWKMDHEMSSGLQIRYPAGGLISTSCITDAE